MSAITEQAESELTALALHEAGHCVTAAALGCKVGYVYIKLMHGALVGRTSYTLLESTKPSGRIAILLAGIIAQSGYSHIRLQASILCLSEQSKQHLPPKNPSRMARAIRQYGIDKKTADRDLLPDGDLVQVRQILADCQYPNRCFNRAEKLARQILDNNELPLRRVAQDLLSIGKLTGVHLAGLLAGITAYDIEVKR